MQSKWRYILSQDSFKTNRVTVHHASHETDALNTDFLITVIVWRHSVFFYHKFDFKQSKKLLARKFYICLCLKLKPQELKGRKNNQGGFQKFKTLSCINGAHQRK